MADRGIIFSAPMVRALLDGRKTQTRRLLADAPGGENWHCDPADTPSGYRFVAEGGAPSLPCRVPHARRDRLYVREAFLPDPSTDDDAWDDWIETYYTWAGCGARLDGLPPSLRNSDNCLFRADAKWADDRFVFRPSIHMPRWASRLTLIVTDVRVQRLQEISDDDATAEGIAVAEPLIGEKPRAAPLFKHLWNSLHTKDGTRWQDNPWIYALTFDVKHGNIDRIAG